MKTAAIVGYEKNVRNYADALQGAGILPLITLSPAEAARCDGLLLPGGGDIHPARFGQENAGSREIDTALDELQLDALDRFVRAEKPVFGICRGHQVVNVYFGGDLIQDLPTAQTHMEDGHTDRIHPVRSLPGSIPCRLYGPQMVTNTTHHQGLGVMGRGLRAVSFAPDGVIEAAEHESLPIFTVQWHPERMAFAHARPDTADGRPVFEWFKQAMER